MYPKLVKMESLSVSLLDPSDTFSNIHVCYLCVQSCSLAVLGAAVHRTLSPTPAQTTHYRSNGTMERQTIGTCHMIHPTWEFFF